MTREVPDWVQDISPFVDRHLPEADKEKLKKCYDVEVWKCLMAEAKSLLGTDPAAPAALALASKWKAGRLDGAVISSAGGKTRTLSSR